MSIHCLLCGHQDNFITTEFEELKECVVDKKTWIVLKVHNDSYEKLSKKPIEEWWVHRLCFRNFLINNTDAPTKLKDEVKWLKEE